MAVAPLPPYTAEYVTNSERSTPFPQEAPSPCALGEEKTSDHGPVNAAICLGAQPVGV